MFSPILSLESYSVEFLVVSFDKSAIGFSSGLISLLWSYIVFGEVSFEIYSIVSFEFTSTGISLLEISAL